MRVSTPHPAKHLGWVALVATVGKFQQTERERQTKRITCKIWRHDESQTKHTEHTEHTKIARVERHEKWDIHNERKGESKINKIELCRLCEPTTGRTK